MKVKILGEEIDIKFNMATEIAYEEITGEPFNIEALSKMKNTVALDMAAIIVANPDTSITIEDLMTKANGKEIGDLNNAVIATMTEWLQIPKVVADVEAGEEQPDVNDEQPKN
jgi:hypothetical protein